MKYKVGDKVRVRSDLQINRSYGAYTFVSEMSDYKGSVVAISEVYLTCYCIEEDKGIWKWTDEMLEGLVEDELTAEEAIKVLADMCAGKCKDCELGKFVKESKYSFCSDYRREHPDEVVEILKQWKKDHEKKEVKVQDKMYCRIVDGDGSTVYTESLPDESILNDRMTEILTKFCSEHDSNYFAVCERRWEVVKS